MMYIKCNIRIWPKIGCMFLDEKENGAENKTLFSAGNWNENENYW